MRNRFNSMRTASRRRTAAEVIDSLEEDLNASLGVNDVTPIEEEENNSFACAYEGREAADLMAEANAFLASIDGTPVPDDNNFACAGDEVLSECSRIESTIAKIEEEEKGRKEEKEASEILASCDDIERRIVAAERRASTVRKGIEDRIGDQVHGGQASVSSLARTKIQTGTRKGVFGTNSRSQYVASITKRLDRVADILEKQGKTKMAFRIDRLADAIEQEANRY